MAGIEYHGGDGEAEVPGVPETDLTATRAALAKATTWTAAKPLVLAVVDELRSKDPDG